MTQLCLVRTRADLAMLAGLVAARRLGTPSRRILVVADEADTPEAAPRLADQPGLALLAARFDEMVSYNDAVHPNHPREWRPRPEEEPMWERYFRALWQLGDGPLQVVAPDLHRPPGGSLAVVLADAPVLAYLTAPPSYGPTPRRLPVRLGHRVAALHYLDLVPGLAPLALAEWGVVPIPLRPSQLPRDEASARPWMARLQSGQSDGGPATAGSLPRELLARLPNDRRAQWLLCAALHRGRSGVARTCTEQLRRRLLATRRPTDPAAAGDQSGHIGTNP